MESGDPNWVGQATLEPSAVTLTQLAHRPCSASPPKLYYATGRDPHERWSGDVDVRRRRQPRPGHVARSPGGREGR